jgi:serine/threonine protein kinase
VGKQPQITSSIVETMYDNTPWKPFHPANHSNDGVCHKIMHFSLLVDTWRISIFGAVNASVLILAAFFLVARLSSFYRRSYAEQDAPLQQLLLSANNDRAGTGDFHSRIFHSPRRQRGASTTETKRSHQTQPTKTKSGKKSSVPKFLLGGSWEGLQGRSGTDVIIVLPEYYIYTLITCMIFLVQAIAWIIPPGDLLGSLSSSLVFMTCLWNDTLLLLHLIRRPGASAMATGILALIPTVAVTLFVHAWLPGQAGTCSYCSVHVPKPGIEYAWMICGMIALWVGICGHKGWSLLLCSCHQRNRSSSPLLHHTAYPPTGAPPSSPAYGSPSVAPSNTSTSSRARVDSFSYGGKNFLKPRKATTVLALMMASVYLLSAASIFVLHYVGDSVDGGYCVLLLSDLAYTFCYAPVLLRTVLVDSKECREYLVSTVLRRTLRMGADSPIKFGQTSTDPAMSLLNGGPGSPGGGPPPSNRNNNYQPPKVDLENPRLRDWTEAKRERQIQMKKEKIETLHTQDIMFRLLTDPVLNLMNPQDLRFDAQIGVGGFGDVFLGSWRQLPVAIKRLHGVDLKQSQVLESLALEAGMLASFRHPNTVLFIGMVLTREYCGLVTEYMEGGSVRELLDRCAPNNENTNPSLDWSIRTLLLRDAARGMVYLHSATPEPVIHRDLKSANFLIDHRTNPRVCKVCDFGLSTYKEQFAKERSRVGTPLFAAPEVLRSDEYSESADVYSFGVCCWEILTMSRPFEDMNTVKALHDVAYKGLRPTLTDEERKNAPEWVDFLIQRCFVNIPEDRPTMDDILSFIEEEMRKAQRKAEKGRSGKNKSKSSTESEEKLKQARIRLTMGRERRSESKNRERKKYASSTV